MRSSHAGIAAVASGGCAGGAVAIALVGAAVVAGQRIPLFGRLFDQSAYRGEPLPAADAIARAVAGALPVRRVTIFAPGGVLEQSIIERRVTWACFLLLVIVFGTATWAVTHVARSRTTRLAALAGLFAGGLGAIGLATLRLRAPRVGSAEGIPVAVAYDATATLEAAVGLAGVFALATAAWPFLPSGTRSAVRSAVLAAVAIPASVGVVFALLLPAGNVVGADAATRARLVGAAGVYAGAAGSSAPSLLTGHAVRFASATGAPFVVPTDRRILVAWPRLERSLHRDPQIRAWTFLKRSPARVRGLLIALSLAVVGIVAVGARLSLARTSRTTVIPTAIVFTAVFALTASAAAWLTHVAATVNGVNAVSWGATPRQSLVAGVALASVTTAVVALMTPTRHRS